MWEPEEVGWDGMGEPPNLGEPGERGLVIAFYLSAQPVFGCYFKCLWTASSAGPREPWAQCVVRSFLPERGQSHLSDQQLQQSCRGLRERREALGRAKRSPEDRGLVLVLWLP